MIVLEMFRVVDLESEDGAIEINFDIYNKLRLGYEENDKIRYSHKGSQPYINGIILYSH